MEPAGRIRRGLLLRCAGRDDRGPDLRAEILARDRAVVRRQFDDARGVVLGAGLQEACRTQDLSDLVASQRQRREEIAPLRIGVRDWFPLVEQAVAVQVEEEALADQA